MQRSTIGLCVLVLGTLPTLGWRVALAQDEDEQQQPQAQPADVPSFSYVFISGGYEERRTEDAGQVYKGPGFGGSINLGSHFFVDADYGLLKSRPFERVGAPPSSGGLPLPPPSGSPTVSGRLQNQSWSVGLGAHTALANDMDFTLSGSYLRNHIEGIDGFSDNFATQGWGAAAGLRYSLFRWLEINGGGDYTHVEGVGNTAPYAGLVINFNRTWSIAGSHSWLQNARETSFTLRASFDTRNNK